MKIQTPENSANNQKEETFGSSDQVNTPCGIIWLAMMLDKTPITTVSINVTDNRSRGDFAMYSTWPPCIDPAANVWLRGRL